MEVRKVVTAPRNGALLHTKRFIHRELKAQMHEVATTERLISLAISDHSVEEGVKEGAIAAGVTGVGATGATAGAVAAPGDVEEEERERHIRNVFFAMHAFQGGKFFLYTVVFKEYFYST